MTLRLPAPLVLLLKGFCMGAADVVPGVSGGTMAFILGIYTRLIDAIRSFDFPWLMAIVRFDLRTALTRPHFLFLIPLGIGILSAIVFFTRVVPIPRLIHTHPEHIYGLFFGLIVGSILVLCVDIGWRSIRDFLGFAIGILLGGVIVTAVPTTTPDTWWFITVSGAVAICAMILPGISGSFILLILGKYAYALDGIGRFDLAILIPFALGAAAGLALFARLLSWLLHHYERLMLLVICGFLLASLWVVWPFQERHFVLVRGKERLLESTPVLPSLDSVAAQSFALTLVGIVVVVGAMAISKHQRSAAATGSFP
jgi:putative membrane protein